MPRLTNKKLRKKFNSYNHARGRTTRGHRLMSKFKKYKWDEVQNGKKEE